MATAGRKRSFDTDQALDQAMRVFWENGFAGTSMADLTSALGINKPSLYAAFGNKEQLFHAAVTHYVEHYGNPLLTSLLEPAEAPFVDRLQAFMLATVEQQCSEAAPRGCFMVKGCVESGSVSMPQELTETMQTLTAELESGLREVFEKEKINGNLDASVDTREFAGYVLTMMYGMSVMAKRGKSCEELKSIVEAAVKNMSVT